MLIFVEPLRASNDFSPSRRYLVSLLLLGRCGDNGRCDYVLALQVPFGAVDDLDTTGKFLLLDSLGENSGSEYPKDKDEEGNCRPFHDTTRTPISVREVFARQAWSVRDQPTSETLSSGPSSPSLRV